MSHHGVPLPDIMVFVAKAEPTWSSRKAVLTPAVVGLKETLVAQLPLAGTVAPWHAFMASPKWAASGPASFNSTGPSGVQLVLWRIHVRAGGVAGGEDTETSPNSSTE